MSKDSTPIEERYVSLEDFRAGNFYILEDIIEQLEQEKTDIMLDEDDSSSKFVTGDDMKEKEKDEFCCVSSTCRSNTH